MPTSTGQAAPPSLTRQRSNMPAPTGQADVHRARQGQAGTRSPGVAQTDQFGGTTAGARRGLVTVPATPPRADTSEPAAMGGAGGAGTASDAVSTNAHTLNVLYHMGYKQTDEGFENLGRASSNKKTANDIIVRLRQADAAGELKAVFTQLQDLGKLGEVQTLFEQSYNTMAHDAFEDFLDSCGYLEATEPADTGVDIEVGTTPAGTTNRLPEDTFNFLAGGTRPSVIFKMILGELGYKQSGRVLEYVGRAASNDKVADNLSIRLGHAVRPATLKVVVDHLRMTGTLDDMVAVAAKSPSSTDMDNLIARLQSPDASKVKWYEDNNRISHGEAVAASAYTKIGEENKAALQAALDKVGMGHLL